MRVPCEAPRAATNTLESLLLLLLHLLLGMCLQGCKQPVIMCGTWVADSLTCGP